MALHPPALVMAFAVVLTLGSVSPAHPVTAPPEQSAIDAREVWIWPVTGAIRITKPFHAPAHDYAAGHRGIDLAPDAPVVRAPASGTVAFAGVVVDRPLLTIDHGDGLVTTLEPVASDLGVGAAVSRGEPIGEVASGGHTEPGDVHFGVRRHGDYINPTLLLGGHARAVLLPCCAERQDLSGAGVGEPVAGGKPL